jgi:zinc D-Ala-D-Ala carboxypeptidase
VNLSANFTLAEFLRSQTAARMGRKIEPTESDIRNLKRLCVTILEPLRMELGRAIHITSGLRHQWLNTAIGGSQTSAHMDGRAADIVVPGLSALDVCRVIQSVGLSVDQVIHEFGEWSHVGIAKDGEVPRNQYLTARVLHEKTVYEVGLNA